MHTQKQSRSYHELFGLLVVVLLLCDLVVVVIVVVVIVVFVVDVAAHALSGLMCSKME